MTMLQVIGDPVLHSKSPLIHTTMLDYLGLDISYTPHVVKKGELSQYLAFAKVHGVTGFNATTPHKEDLIPLVDELGQDAQRCGAVNTVCFRNGKWIGHNTDGEGCLAALQAQGLWPARGVVILGAGGAAKAVALRLAREQAGPIWVCNRTLSKAQQLCQLDPAGVLIPAGFDPDTLTQLCAQAQLVMNCTNLGMAGCAGQFPDFSFLDAVPQGAGVMDLIYHPAQTQLLQQAQAKGLKTCNGLPMLVYQAIFALEYFLNRTLHKEELAQAVFSKLAQALAE